MNFWQKLKKKKGTGPILAMAPMLDVTDYAFRQMFLKYGRPDVFWTEFVSADGLVLAPEEGKKKLLQMLKFDKKERPIVAQIFSAVPENIFHASKLVASLGFLGVDINMGCPEKNIVKQGAGAGLIKNPKLAKEIILSAKNGVLEYAREHNTKPISVSVKTRVGFNQIEIEKWLPEILSAGPDLVTIHARTRKEMSKVLANWDLISRAVEIKNEIAPQVLILGNGDVTSVLDAFEKIKKTGADGVMVGRALLGNPWFFNKKYSNQTPKEKFKAVLEHVKLFEKHCPNKPFHLMKKFFKVYIEGFPGAKEIRNKLMETNNYKEVKQIVDSLIRAF